FSFKARSSCVGEDVTLTCAVPGTGRLTWVIGSSDNTILFNLADDSSLTTQTDSTGQFTASLTNYSRDQQYSFLGDLTSTLHTRVNPSLTDYPIKILCYNGISNNISVPSYIKIAGFPSPPWNLTSSVVYGISRYSLVVGWESPRDDGGVEIDNYTLSLHQEDQTVVQTTTESLELRLSLDYSTVYSIIITANNCAGTSYPVSLTSVQAGCRAPPSPVNGSIEEYRSTEEGAEIQFHCQNGYTPNERMSSQCLNSSWSLHPTDLVCVFTPPPKPPTP
ncbi:hypothetical protein GBAR_LOCUS14918, partial [Geodia barretti]